MIWSPVPDRSDKPELMDAPGLSPEEVAAAYGVLRRVNRQLGNLRTICNEVERFRTEEKLEGQRIRLLDVGSGSGDLPVAIAERFGRRGIQVSAVALDRDPTAVGLTVGSPVDAVRGDALRLPFADSSFDLVTAVKFAHHFAGEGLRALICEMARVAARGVLILDIRRHWLAYWGFIAWSRLLTRNRLVRYDGPLSVLRGFTRSELLEAGAAVPGFRWVVRSYLGFQLALVGHRLR